MANFQVSENPEYTEEIRKFETEDEAHADLFNNVVQKLINNEAFLKKGLGEKADTNHAHAAASQTEAGFLSIEDKKKLDEETGEKEIEFTQVDERENLTSGEKLKISLGKIKKWLADLKTVAFTGSYSDLSNKPTIPAVIIDSPVDFDTLTEDGIYIIISSDNINCPENGPCILFVNVSETHIDQTVFKFYPDYQTIPYQTTLNLYMRYHGEGNYGHIQWWDWHEAYVANARKAIKADEATKAIQDADGNVITDSYVIRKTIAEGDFNDMTTPGLYTMRQVSDNKPLSSASYYGLLVLKSDNGNYIEQLAFRENSSEVYVRTCSGSNWTAWIRLLKEGDLSDYLTKTGDSANNTITFSSPDESSPASWVNVPVITSGEKHGIIFNKIVNMCRNVRYLYKRLGTTSISSLGDGTVTGAINTLNTNLSTWETLTISETYSGFKYTGGLMKYHPILKLAFISVTIQATVATTTGVKIDMCKFNKVPSVNTALSARTPNTSGQAVNVAIFTDGTLSLSTDKAIPKDEYILCSGIYSFT